jgi:hypothetical protein
MMKQNSLHSKIVLAVLIFTSALISLLRLDSFQVGAFSDDASYIVLAESMASGQGYRLINYPDAPRERSFPPGWPILLLPIVILFPDNYEILKWLPFALWLVTIPLLYKLFAKRINTPYLEILIALIVVNPVMIGASGMVMSETAYLFFSVLTLYLFELWNSHLDNPTEPLFVIAFAATALYTQLIRTVGLSILLAIIAYLLLSRRLRQAGIATMIFFLGMLPQFWFNSRDGGSIISRGYQTQVFHDSVSIKLWQAWANAQTYLNEMIANSLIPIFGPNIESMLDRLGLGVAFSLVNVFVLLLIAIGFVLSFKSFQLSELYVFLFFIGILSFWNPDVGSAQDRFLIPIIPFLFYYFLQGLIWSARTVTRTDRRTVFTAIGVTSLIMLIFLVRNVQDWRNPIRNQMTDLSIGTVWVSENTPSKSIIMSRNPVPDYLYVHRTTIAYPTEDQDLIEYIIANNIDYVIVSPKLQALRSNDLGDYVKTHLLPILTLNEDKFRPVYTDRKYNVTVYEYRSAP